MSDKQTSPPLFEAIKNGNEELILELLKSNTVDVNEKINEITPLHLVLEKSLSPQIVIALIQSKADVNSVRSHYGCHHSISESCFQKIIKNITRFQCDHLELLSLLLEQGANPNEFSNNYSGGMRSDYNTRFYPIHTLTQQNAVGCVTILLNAKANVNSYYEHSGDTEYGHSTRTKETPLHIAVQKKNLEMMRLLIEWKADINLVRNYMDNREKKTVRTEDDIVDDEFLDPRDSGYVSTILNVNTQRTCLHMAIQEKSLDLVRYLILNGANPYIPYTESTWGVPGLQLSSWELCQGNEELKQLLEIQFTPKDYEVLSFEHKRALNILLLCDKRNNWLLPKDILFKIFTFLIRFNCPIAQ